MSLLITTRKIDCIIKNNAKEDITIDYHELLLQEPDKFKFLFDSTKTDSFAFDGFDEISQNYAKNSDLRGLKVNVRNQALKKEDFQKLVTHCVTAKFQHCYKLFEENAQFYIFYTIPSELGTFLKFQFLKHVISRIPDNQSLELLLHTSDWNVGDIQTIRSEYPLQLFTHEPNNFYIKLIINKLIEGKINQAWTNLTTVPEIEKYLIKRERLIWEREAKDKSEQIMNDIFEKLK